MSTQVGRWSEVLEGFEVVYHLAWTTKPQSANDDPCRDVESNVVAGLQFLDALVRLPTMPKLLFVSTGGAIYGPPEYVPLDERHPTRPVNAYGIGKLALEHYLGLYQRLHGLDYLVFRPGNPYGEEQDPAGAQGAVAVFLGRIFADEAIDIWGDGEIVRDYLYIGDLIDALLAGIDYLAAQDGARVFNIGSGAGVSLNELVATLAVATAKMPRTNYLPARKTDTPAVVLDCRLARSVLGWVPRTSLEDGLARTWRWLCNAKGVS